MVQPLPTREMEVDEFQFNYTTLDKPHVQNDTVTLHKRYAQVRGRRGARRRTRPPAARTCRMRHAGRATACLPSAH